MRDFIAGEETSLGGCLALCCLTIIAGGYLVSAVVNVGRPDDADERAARRPVVQTETSAEPESVLSEEESPTFELEPEPEPEPQPPPPPPPPARTLHPLCERLVNGLALIDDCDLMDTGSSVGSTLFLTVDASILQEGVAGEVTTQIHEELVAARTRPGVLALESADESWMIGLTELQTCLTKQRTRREPCIEQEFSRIRKR